MFFVKEGLFNPAEEAVIGSVVGVKATEIQDVKKTCALKPAYHWKKKKNPQRTW